MSDLIQAILNVLTIIALIAALAFIIILIVDLVLSITNRKGSIFFRGRNNDQETKPVVQNETRDEVIIRPTVLQNDTQVQSWDEAEAQREQLEIANQPRLNAESELATALEKDLESEHRQEVIEQKKQEFDDFDDFDALFAEKEENKEATETQEVEQLNFDDLIAEVNSESVAKYEANKDAEDIENAFDELFNEETKEVEEEAKVAEETKTQEAGAESQATTVVVEEEKEEVKEEPVEEVAKPIVNVYEYFPIDALNERLAKLQERLKINERDLKGNRKEYNPLARVERSLKRDQEKLRRREAIVARKKVMLYGVNNYVDIDEEKAKKLSEDLDLLDGLRLSVQHCEEVMEQNKERFPILAKTNEILVAQNKQIKEDIAEVKAAIEKLNETKED